MAWSFFKKNKKHRPVDFEVQGHTSGAFATTVVWSGWLSVRQQGKKDQKRRFCVLSNDRVLHGYKDVSHSGPVKLTINICKEFQVDSTLGSTTITLNNDKTTFFLTCDSEEQTSRWINAFDKLRIDPAHRQQHQQQHQQQQHQQHHHQQYQTHGESSKNEIETTSDISNYNTIQAIMKRDENKHCADCDVRGPTWTSWNIGAFLCVKCAGYHRGLGSHISKVRSTNLDAWSQEQLYSMHTKGNGYNHRIYESNLPFGFIRPQEGRELKIFIHEKYLKKTFMGNGSGGVGSASDNGSRPIVIRVTSQSTKKIEDGDFEIFSDDDIPIEEERPMSRGYDNAIASSSTIDYFANHPADDATSLSSLSTTTTATTTTSRPLSVGWTDRRISLSEAKHQFGFVSPLAK